MGKHLFRTTWSILLLAVVTTLHSEESPEKEEIGFTIQSGEDREIRWGVKFSVGEEKDLSEEEKARLFEETIFPRVLRDANAGKNPEVWQIGFFYLDGQGTGANQEKAEAAFRRGLEFNHPEGLIFLVDYLQELGVVARAEPARRDEYFRRAESIALELLEAGFPAASRSAIYLAKAHLFGWYDLEVDPGKAESILRAVEKATPDNPSCQIWLAKVFIEEKRYPEAFDYAKSAQATFEDIGERTAEIQEELKLSRAVKITAAVLGGEISKIDPEEFMNISKESLGLTGKRAWFVPVILLLVLCFLLWRTRKAWAEEEGGGPGLRLSVMWLSAAVLAAGIGFNIRLPGLDNGVGHWIGAIMVTIICLVAMTMVGWPRYFGSRPLVHGIKPILKGLLIIVVGIVGMQLVAAGYGVLYKMVLGKALDQQLVSLFLKSENPVQLAGTVFIVGIAIPFYEEIFFRGFLYESLERKWNPRVALIWSSIIFAIVHGLTFFVPLLFLSFALGWLRRKNGNLRMCFFLHAANNSFAVLVGYFNQAG
ncbi:MAG: CPBP family glutamic-type intramembrane protease [Verrucomicrobiales bacterium]|nr:CPBP family glutamic-type intramembrane protease [Verrucomicrobiales bacterium]